MVVKTFRGQLADGGQDRIRLQTIKGKVGYRIVSFQVMGEKMGTDNYEAVLSIYKTNSAPSSTVNFTDSDLLAAAFFSANATANNYPEDIHVIFDKEIFNQDIFVNYVAANHSNPMNYYLELEVIPLDDAGAEYTTLKDMRQA